MSIYDDEIDLRPYIFALRKKWWLIAIVTVMAAGAALVYSILQVKINLFKNVYDGMQIFFNIVRYRTLYVPNSNTFCL